MKVNYLNNRDLLLEIHKSKTTYCSFINQIDNEYDIIIHDAALILDHETMQQGRKLRADRLARQAFVMAKSKGEAVKAAQFAMTPEQISPDDVVFRLMTKAHIPEMELKVLEGAELNELLDIEDADILPIKYVKVNFPPFQHFKVVPHALGAPMPDTAVCVGKSHWKGDLVTGEYCREHGAMTKKLANMFMKLCERYATRSNWRGYCVDTATEALTQRGWLDIDSITEDDTILSYTNGKLTWSSIKSIYRGHYSGPMHKITSRSVDFLITPKHKLVTSRGLVEAELVKQSDQVIVMGDAVIAPTEKTYSDSFVVTAELGNLTFEFILKLTSSQRELLVDALNKNINGPAVNKKNIDLIQSLLALTGTMTSSNNASGLGDIEFFSSSENKIKAESLNFNGGMSDNEDKGTYPNTPTVPYDGMVWCPETEYGCFVARRNGKVYLTGNTYNDEMRCQALLQLSQIGLQFDESKSQNPFAYFTSVISNSFTRVLNIEKRNQNIRDDILEMNGMNPSYTRQNSGSNHGGYEE